MSKEAMRTIFAAVLRSKPVGVRVAIFNEQRRLLARSSVYFANQNSVSLKDGLVRFRTTLPGDKEPCQFTLKPAIDRVGDLATAINAENPSRYAQIRIASSADDVQFARATPIEALLRHAFTVTIRDAHGELVSSLSFDKADGAAQQASSAVANASAQVAQLKESVSNLTSIQTVVDRLHAALHFDEMRNRRRTALEARLGDIGKQLETLEQERLAINTKALRRARTFSWVGLGYMGIQCGLLARLTWWEYSWDIVEPCTYFVGYATLMVYFAYYLLTRQEWTFPAAEERQYAIYFHALADKRKFDLPRYIELRKQADSVRADLLALGFDGPAEAKS